MPKKYILQAGCECGTDRNFGHFWQNSNKLIATVSQNLNSMLTCGGRADSKKSMFSGTQKIIYRNTVFYRILNTLCILLNIIGARLILWKLDESRKESSCAAEIQASFSSWMALQKNSNRKNEVQKAAVVGPRIHTGRGRRFSSKDCNGLCWDKGLEIVVTSKNTLPRGKLMVMGGCCSRGEEDMTEERD